MAGGTFAEPFPQERFLPVKVSWGNFPLSPAIALCRNVLYRKVFLLFKSGLFPFPARDLVEIADGIRIDETGVT